MKPTSDAQFEASVSGIAPGLEQIRRDIWSVGLPMGHGGPPYTLTYLIKDTSGSAHVIDPGLDTDENWGLLGEALSRIGTSITDVASVTVTHLHRDHLGMAGRVSALSGAPVAMHEAEQAALNELLERERSDAAIEDQLERWGVPTESRQELEEVARAQGFIVPITADQLLMDGDVLQIPGHALRAIHTPGHTIGHLCIEDAADSILFSGDHILPDLYPGLGLGGSNDRNPLTDYLRSLQRIAAYDEWEVLPGHGYRFTGLNGRREKTRKHHLKRSREVAAALRADQRSTVWQVATTLSWTAGWENLHSFYLQSALAQTAMHIEYLRQHDGEPRDAID